MQRILILSLLLMTSHTVYAAGAGIYLEKYDYNLTPKKGVQEVIVTFHRIGSDFYDRTVYRFDNKGNIVSILNFNGNKLQATTAFTYDERNNEIERKITWPNSTAAEIYTKKYVYNDIGNILEETAAHSDGRFAWHNKYSYDNNNNKILFLHTNCAGEKSTTKYVYNNVGKLIEMHYDALKTESYQYDQKGRITLKMLHSSNRKYLYQYDSAGRLKEIRDMDHKGFLFYRYVFDYNKAGDIVKISSRYKETDAGVTQKGIADYAIIEYK